MKKARIQRLMALAVIGVAAAMSTGCASIFGKSEYPVVINSTPDSANFTIANSAGEQIHTGVTPATVNLQSSADFFRPEVYTITFKKAGLPTKIHTLKSTISGWYFGNLAFGGIIGMLIVDPLTGAMFKLPDSINVNLGGAKAADNGTRSLTVVSIDSLTPEQRQQLVALSN